MGDAGSSIEVVVVDYEDLSGGSLSDDLANSLRLAFGPSGTGIIAVRNVPEFVEAKKRLLPLSRQLANLPPEELAKLEDPDTLYNAGWSHGKEMLKPGVPDKAKGSFYFNPIVDVAGTDEDRKKYPLSYPKNIWPSGSASLPELEPAAKKLGRILTDVTVCVAKHLDAMVHSRRPKDYAPDTMFGALNGTQKVKGRLLYYFPLEEPERGESKEQDSEKDSWIGWHNDSGFLTALAGDCFFDSHTGEVLESPPSRGNSPPGLYVADRADTARHVHLPPDCVGVQLGEGAQIVTGGEVMATPHCVRGVPGLARASLACFVDPPPEYALSSSVHRDEILASSTTTRVPPLGARWKHNGMTFGDFLKTTFELYYSHNSED